MRDITQLENDFELYLKEIERCVEYKCYWSLLHILLVIPDICASLEKCPPVGTAKSGDRYVAWCNEYFPKSTIITGKDRYQMRNTLLHSGSTTADNRSNKNRTDYEHFSFVNGDELSVKIHLSTSAKDKILDLDPVIMAAETILAVYKWFNVLQNDKKKMDNVEINIKKLAKNQPKFLYEKNINGSINIIHTTTKSST